MEPIFDALPWVLVGLVLLGALAALRRPLHHLIGLFLRTAGTRRRLLSQEVLFHWRHAGVD